MKFQKSIHENFKEMLILYLIVIVLTVAATSCENLKFLLLVDMSQSLENPRPRLTMLKFLSQQVKAETTLVCDLATNNKCVIVV